jgi:hypothetical protein
VTECPNIDITPLNRTVYVYAGLEAFTSMEEFKTGKVAEGTKPCLLFAGEPFADTTNLGEAKKLCQYMDIF